MIHRTNDTVFFVIGPIIPALNRLCHLVEWHIIDGILDSSQLLRIIGVQHTFPFKVKTEESSFGDADREAARGGKGGRRTTEHRSGELYRHSSGVD